MLVIELKNPSDLAILGYIRLNATLRRASVVKLCATAAHFRSSVAAAQLRAQLQPQFPVILSVKECHCLQGIALEKQIAGWQHGQAD